MEFDSRPLTSRRDFLKQAATAGGGVVIVHYLDGRDAFAAKGVRSSRLSKQNKSEVLRHQRYEGRAKVTGTKIYGRDFRAKDLNGWPEVERRAVIVRTPLAAKVLVGIDRERLRGEYGDVSLVGGDDLADWGVEAGLPFLMPTFYVRSGAVPDYLGQPVALLSFKSTAEYLRVKSKLQDVAGLLQWGAEKASFSRPPYGTSRFVRYEGADGQEEFSMVKDGPWSPPWAAADAKGSPSARASSYIERIESDLKHHDWRIFHRVYETQSTDPMFMEPECGLSWYESKSQTLHLTLSTQSPQDDGDAILHFFSKAKRPPVKKVMINCCYPGGGFGGRDSSDFPLHLAVAAMAEPDVAHRIVHSRYDQFQAGLKRHPAKIDLLLAVDQRGKFQALKSIMEMDGGGQNNYSFAVQNVGARNASSGYRFPRSWVDSMARSSIAVPAGSVRGFGSFQSTFALECLIDEAADTIGLDPIEFRLNNILTANDHVHTGAELAFNIRIDEVLRAVQRSRLWKERQTAKASATNGQTMYGIGFALGVKSFGKNPGDAVVAGLTMDPHGRLLLMTNSVDMGNGTATTLPLSLLDLLGRPADDIKIGATIDFDPLQLVGPKAKDEADQQELAKNPYWVPYKAMSTAASAGAYNMRHAAREAARVILQWGLWPAACGILGLKAQETVWDPHLISWNQKSFVYKKMRPIPFATLAKKAHQLGLVTGALIHGFYRTRWARATFPIANQSYTSEIDGLALRHGSGDFRAVARSAVDFPPFRTQLAGANRYTPYGIVVAVQVARDTGEVKVVDAEAFLQCGPVTSQPIVEGQMEGGFAMGIGQALTEGFPMIDGGPGQGDWNLHRYRVPLAGDCAVGQATFNILPPHPEDDPRGMAEVVFNPVPAAIVNAVAHATGKRMRRLPLTPEDVKAALT